MTTNAVRQKTRPAGYAGSAAESARLESDVSQTPGAISERQPLFAKSASLELPWLAPVFGALALLLGVIIAFVVTGVSNSLVFLAIVALLVAVGTIARVEWGLLALGFIIYTDFSDVMIKFHGAPSTTKPFILLLIIAIVTRWFLYGHKPTGWERLTLLLGSYGLVKFASLLYAQDVGVAQEAMTTYAKDIVLALVITILLQRATTLRHMIWVLLASGAFLGTISVYQQLTGTFSNNYWGFGQAEIYHIVGQVNDYRIGGPFGPNGFAQNLVVLVPLALDRFWNESSRPLRLVAAWTFAVCVLAIFFTFSRGGFLAMIVVLGLVLIRRPPRLSALLITIAIAIVLVQYLPPKYTDRMKTLLGFLPGSEENALADPSLKGRSSEMSAGWLMFLDHPLLGVGIGNSPLYYPHYSVLLGIDPSRQARATHNLYLQIAAETGLVGLAVFGFVLWAVFRGLKRAREDFIAAQMPNYAGLVIAFGLGLIGYLVSALFKSDAGARTFWMLIGIAAAMPQVAQRELMAFREGYKTQRES